MGCEWLGDAALLCRLHMRPLIRGRHGCNEPCIEVASDHFGFFAPITLQIYKDFAFLQHYWRKMCKFVAHF